VYRPTTAISAAVGTEQRADHAGEVPPTTTASRMIPGAIALNDWLEHVAFELLHANDDDQDNECVGLLRERAMSTAMAPATKAVRKGMVPASQISLN
jgi:hypothetical protein